MHGKLRRILISSIPTPIKFYLKRIIRGGQGTKCPLCKSSIRNFVAAGHDFSVLYARNVVGAGRREADACPICGSRARARLLHLCLETILGSYRQEVRLLHLAPEYGVYRWLESIKEVHYVAADFDPSQYNDIPRIKKADVTSLPFSDEDFDVIICSHVLEHVPEDILAMKELYRVLRPGGKILAPVPVAGDGLPTDEDPSVEDPQERIRRFGQSDHVRLYALEDYIGRLESVGFTVEIFDPFLMNREIAESYNLNPREVIPVGQKLPR